MAQARRQTGRRRAAPEFGTVDWLLQLLDIGADGKLRIGTPRVTRPRGGTNRTASGEGGGIGRTRTRGGAGSGGGPSLSIRVEQDAGSARRTGGVLGRAALREVSGGRRGERVDDLRGYRRLTELDFADSVALRNRRADFMRDLIGEAEEDLAAEGQLGPRRDAAEMVAAFVRRMRWTLHVGGTHYGGLSHDDLLDVLESQGRDFRADTPALRAHVAADLSSTFTRVPWSEDRAADLAADAIREWIVRRFENQGGDISLAPLDRTYRRQKASDGFGTQIGIRTGSLLSRVKNAEVIVTA